MNFLTLITGSCPRLISSPRAVGLRMLLLVWTVAGLACFTSFARAENIRAKVTEVKGAFVKLEVSGDAGVTVGSAGKLYRLSSGAAPQGEVTLTLVQAGYSVGKVTGGTPEVGDFVLLPKSEAATKPASGTGAAAPKPTSADDASPEKTTPADKPTPTDKFDDLVGKELNLLLTDEQLLEEAKLLRVARDSKTGRLKALRLEVKGGDQKTVFLTQLKEVTHAGEPVELPAAEAEATTAKIGAPKTRNQLLGEQRAAREAKEKEAWLVRIKERGIEPWKELTDEDHQAAIDAHKKTIESIQKAYQGMQLAETAHFLFCTNIPPEQVGPYVMSLDKMHEMMCTMYNIKKGTKVWKGKALVVAFLTQEEFMDFERKFMELSLPQGVYGICHQESDGDVTMACFRGDRQADFGQMLVHETSHGFIHRYKTPITFPNWVNEGMADYVGVAMVPACKSVRLGEQMAIAQMRETRSMGGDFFTKSHLDAWQYGVASTLADFMITNNAKAYVKFIEGMKEGLSWEESLKEAYKSTPEELVSSYGRAIGVPDLRP